jgi:hypothetical protein
MTWGKQPVPVNAPPAQTLGLGVQPGTPSVIRARQVIIIGSGGELLVYSPTAGAGNLIASIAGAAFTDPYGNAVVQGVTGYQSPGLGVAVGFVSGEVNFYSGPVSGAGPWTVQWAFTTLTGQLQLSGLQTGSSMLVHSGGATPTAAGTVIDNEWAGGQTAFYASGVTQTYTNTTVLATDPNLQVTGLVPSGVYTFKLHVVYDGLNSGANGGLTWSVATDGSGHAGQIYEGLTGAQVTNADVFPLSGHQAKSSGVGSFLSLTIRGTLFLPANTTGAVSMQFAQAGASATPTTLYDGTYMILKRIT